MTKSAIRAIERTDEPLKLYKTLLLNRGEFKFIICKGGAFYVFAIDIGDLNDQTGTIIHQPQKELFIYCYVQMDVEYTWIL